MKLLNLEKTNDTNQNDYERNVLKKSFFCKKVENKEELNMALNLRYKIYCKEKGYLDKNKYVTKLERDKYDDFSTHFIVLNSANKAIGTVRIISKSPIGFEIENNINGITINDRTMCAEISRLMIDIDIKKTDRKKIVMSLFKGICKTCLVEDIRYLYAMVDDEFLERVYGTYNIKYKQIDKTRFYSGHMATPCLIDLKEVKNDLFKNNKLIHDYLFIN